MLPVFALVGRPNVGKSTLFNCLTRSKEALVADLPGLTRDRQYGIGKIGDHPYLVIDTGGLTGETGDLDQLIARQVWYAVEEADAVLFLVDGRAGLTSADEEATLKLRRSGKPVYLVVNKTEYKEPGLACAEFFNLGMGQPYAISATHRRGIVNLMTAVLREFSTTEAPEAPIEPVMGNAIRLAVVGRPNVGKSTLVNRLLGEERVLAYDKPGTTRDSIAIPFSKDGKDFLLIDTAGIRRRSRINDKIEKFSVIKTLQAIEQAHVTIMMIDARQGVSEQDATLLGYILDSGRALVVAINKWDRLEQTIRDNIRQELGRRLVFLNFADFHFISALHGSGIGALLHSVANAYEAATRNLSTSELTRILQDAVASHQPPLIRGQSIKLRYAHQGGRNPPLIVIHGNRVDQVPESYRRYLMNAFRKALKLRGTPLCIEFKTSDNPFHPSKPAHRHMNRNAGKGISTKSSGRGR